MRPQSQLAFTAALVVWSVGCVTTDVGNPVEIEVGFAGYEEQPVNALTLDSGITIARALVSVEGLGFSDAARCASDPTLDAPGRYTVDLLEGEVTPALPLITREQREFCGLRMRLAPLPAANGTDDMVPAEAELAGISVLIDGTRADGTAFEVRAPLTDTLALDAVGRSFTLEGREQLIVGFALNEWLSSHLDAEDGSTGTIRIADPTHPVIQSLRNGITGSTRLYRDLDEDGVLETIEITEPLAVGVSVDVDVTLPNNASPANTDDNASTPPDALCDVMADGPSVSLTAVASNEDELDDDATEEARTDVALVSDDDGTFFGWIRFDRSDDSDWVIGFDIDVPITLWDDTGTEVPPHETDVLSCGGIGASYEFETEPGDYLMYIGPSPSPTVRFVYDD